jgi:hypothetical protein
MTIHGQLPSDPESLTATVNHVESMVPCLFLVSAKQSRQILQPKTTAGWWFFATPLKNDGVKVSWDD